MTWGGWAIAVLLTLTCVLAIMEFYGGKELNLRIKKSLEHWWLLLAEINVPNVGRSEAQFALRLMHRLFGRRAVSWRRIKASLFIAVIVEIFSISFSAGELLDTAPIESKLLIGHSAFWLLLPFLILPVWLYSWYSLSVSNWILERSLMLIGRKRFGTFLFFLVIVGGLLGTALAMSLFLFVWAVFGSLVGIGISAIIGMPLLSTPSLNMSLLLITSPALTASFLIPLIRPLIFLGFLFWIATGVFLRFISLTIYRLCEAEKGALTIFASALTTVATIIKLLLPGSH